MAIIVIYAVIVMRGLRAALTAQEAVQQAARSWTVVRVRPAGVRDHGRCHQAAAADRPDHAVHLPGRLLGLIANYAMIGLLMVVTHRVRRPPQPDREAAAVAGP